MKHTRAYAILCSAALLCGTSTALAANEQLTEVRRFALVTGANNGGRDRVLLRHAKSDANAFSQVMGSFGGVASRDRILLADPSPKALRKGFAQLASMLQRDRRQNQRVQVIFYYSGHSDDGGLLLGRERFPYGDIRRELAALKADVRIAILDSCASGALTRTKGGVRRAPFLVDASSDIKGHAFLTSSSATEAAQESDTVGGSFFTHYLVSGLRGAAHVSGDGRVTLTEAYQFAFNETLARTENTRAGPQHPNYDFQLSGTGDLVMTEIKDSSSTITFEKEITGRIFLRDADGHLIAELRKTKERRISLGVEPGEYSITLEDDTVQATRVSIAAGGNATLTPSQFTRVAREGVTRKGRAADPSIATKDLEYEAHTFCFGIFPGLSTCNKTDKKVLQRGSLNLLMGSSDRVQGWQVSGIANVAHDGIDGVQISGVAGLNEGALQGFQGSGVFSHTGGSVDGVQMSGAVSSIGGTLRGVQIAGGVSYLHGNGLKAGQGAGGANVAISDEFSGIQAAGGFNYLHGDLVGGVQGAGGFNFAGGDVQGVQFAGGANIAGGGVRGAQVAVVNIAGDLAGAQVGVVNIAAGKVKGTQVGLVNVSSEYESGAPVGLFNFVRHGQLHVDVWTSDISAYNLSLKFGSKHVYTILNAGGQPRVGSAKFARLTYGLGFGGTIPITEGLYVATDLTANKIAFIAEGQDVGDALKDAGEANNFHSQLRLMVGFKLYEHLGAFAGATLNGHYAWGEFEDRPGLVRGPSAVARDGKFVARFWPGVVAGLQL